MSGMEIPAIAAIAGAAGTAASQVKGPAPAGGGGAPRGGGAPMAPTALNFMGRPGMGAGGPGAARGNMGAGQDDLAMLLQMLGRTR